MYSIRKKFSSMAMSLRISWIIFCVWSGLSGSLVPPRLSGLVVQKRQTGLPKKNKPQEFDYEFEEEMFNQETRHKKLVFVKPVLIFSTALLVWQSKFLLGTIVALLFILIIATVKIRSKHSYD